MMKSVLGVAVAIAFCSVANAADQGQGKVNFKGTVIDAPCGIAPESADQSIDFGQISKAHLAADGISVKKDLDVKDQANELGTAGNTGTAVVVSSSDGTLVAFDGTSPSGATKLKAGDNTLHYNTWVKKATGGTLKEGEFTAVTNFNLTYE